MFMLISNEPIKVTDLQKLANQLANADWHTGDNLSERERERARKTLVVWQSKKHSNQNKNRDI